MRSGSRRGNVSSRKASPTSATGRPKGVMSNSSKPGSPVSTWYWPLTTRLVLVPIMVSVPPRMAL